MSLRGAIGLNAGAPAPARVTSQGASGANLLKGRTAQRLGGAFGSASARRGQAQQCSSQASDIPVVKADAVCEPVTSRVPVTGRGAGPIVMCLASGDGSASGSSVSLVDPPPATGDALTFPANGTTSPASEGASPSDVDSRQYVREVINLSVELDPMEENMDNYTTGLSSADDEEDEGEAAPSTGTAAAQAEPTISEERAAARALMAGFNPSVHIGDRHGWMIVTAPDVLVAGEEAIILFNRIQSEALRVRPRLQLQYAFNAWDLNNNGANFTADMSPAPMPKDYSDFWWARIKIPEKAFELNFVITDCEGLYENNSMQDFMYPVVEGPTTAEWALMQAEILRKKEEERLEEERKKAEEESRLRAIKLEAEKRAFEEAERIRQEDLRKQDTVNAAKKVEALLRSYADNQRKGVTYLRSGPNQDDPLAPLVWTVEPVDARAGGKAKLYYNRKFTNLNHLNINLDQAITFRWGINGWVSPKVVDMKRSTPPTAAAAAPDGDWWETEIEIPVEATVIDFVVNFFNNYDNNGSKDYHLKVALPEGQTLETWASGLTERLRIQEFETRVAAEAEARQREMRRQEKKKKAQESVMAVERRKVRHVLFTEPEIVKAGEEVTIWYNPENTNLTGRNQIFLQCGFNRWSHRSPVGPLPMLPPDVFPTFDNEGNEITPYLVRSGSPTHWKATFVVPHDAYKMDFVFSDVAGGIGTYDNRGGYDYHLPVEGSPVKENSLYVVHVAVEMAPIAKVGGLGDVVTALSRAVKEQGHVVEICIPKYEFFNYSPVLSGQMRFETEYDWGGTRVVVSTAMVEGVRVWFIEPRNGFFNTQSVYGRYDDEVRFDFFCKASLEFLLRSGRQPDILHCHDWSTAHVAKAFWEDYHPYGLWKPRVVFTIHNLNYGQKKLQEAAQFCQKFTTVSPTYAFETGGSPVIAPHLLKFCGIRNGIDPELWDPENNLFLPAPITPENVVAGKKAARDELRKRVNLTSWQDKLIIAVVSRLTPQKGVHLIKHTAFRTVDRGGQFVLLGSAPDPKVQDEFAELAASMGGQDAAFCFKYDEPLSHLIYAAADIIVVPSMFEPCGLTQMIAMRYGAVPVVRHTGGLRDTVFDVDFDKGRAAWELYGSSDWQRDDLDGTNGFAFEGTDPTALDYALNRCIDAYYNDREWFRGLQRRIMEQDWSWNRPGLDYIELYFSAIKE